MKSKLYLLLVLAFIVQLSFAQDPDGPKSADDILATAQKAAIKEGKNVFIMWHASWCGWCHKMDTLMNDESIKQYFDDSYVIEHMVVKESPKNKHLENPGAAEVLAKYKGDKAGIPFWIVLDKNGKLLADAYMRPDGIGFDEAGTNTGCPQTEEEVDHWIKVLKETSDISVEGLDKISSKFQK